MSIPEIKAEIHRLGTDLHALGPGPEPVAQFTEHGNMIRRIDHLERIDKIKSDIIAAYQKYTELLEAISLSLLEIERDMTRIVRRTPSY